MFATTKRLAFFLAIQIALSLVLSSASPSPASAAELIMFERAGCPYCAAFNREIAPVYALTQEGKRIPLRRFDSTQPVPADLSFIRVERLVPVFVLIEDGREVGRIRGYAGEDHFWGMFGVLIERLRKQGAAPGAATPARLAALLER